MAKKDKPAIKEKSIKKLRDLNVADLKKEMLDSTKDEFKLRMQKATGQLTKFHLLKLTRRHIAKAKTLLTEKNRSVAKGV